MTATSMSDKRANHPLSRIEYQVMWNRLISVVEEQAQTLVRTAFGTATREAGDLSAGVYDPKGRMMAQAVVDFPLPDSPTNPKRSPRRNAKLTLSTAWTAPRSVW